MKKLFLIVVVFIFSSQLFSQNLNDYKYALVPSKYAFLKEKDQYKLNTITKLFMEKYGFESYLDTDIFPSDFANENCNKVYVDIEENNSFMITKLKVILKDCKNNVLFFSEEGKSRDKNYNVAYNQALREAFKSFEILKHKYTPSEKSQEKIGEPAVVEVVSEIKSPSEKDGNIANQLYAQPISNGFQLINAEPKVIYKIFTTSLKNYYIATKDNLNGVFFLKNSEWFFEYYYNDKLVIEKVLVKF